MRWAMLCPPPSLRYASFDIMKHIAPASRAGNSLFSIAVLILCLISAFDFPAKTNLVLKYVYGTTVRAAGGLKHSAPRVLGLQNSGLLNEFIQPRSTMQIKSFLPSTAVS